MFKDCKTKNFLRNFVMQYTIYLTTGDRLFFYQNFV